VVVSVLAAPVVQTMDAAICMCAAVLSLAHANQLPLMTF